MYRNKMLIGAYYLRQSGRLFNLGVNLSSAPAATSHGSDRLLGPAVKNYLRKYGLNSSNVPASGPHGTVTKGDVLNHVLVNKIEPVALGMN